MQEHFWQAISIAIQTVILAITNVIEGINGFDLFLKLKLSLKLFWKFFLKVYLYFLGFYDLNNHPSIHSTNNILKRCYRGFIF